MNKISKMAETSYLLYIHTYIQTYIHIILKSEKIKNLNAIFAFVNNVNFRREILKLNFSPFDAFSQRGFTPFGIPTKGSALRTRASASGANICLIGCLDSGFAPRVNHARREYHCRDKPKRPNMWKINIVFYNILKSTSVFTNVGADLVSAQKNKK